MPRLGDPEFEKLVTTEAWLQFHRTDFAHADEMVRFFPMFKQLMMALASRGAVDELVVLGLYGLDVQRAMIAAGEDFIEHLPIADKTRAARRGGLDKVRLGAAIAVCSLLYLAMSASDERRSAVIAALRSSRSYAFHSREGLQLIMATLDERLLPRIGTDLKQAYQGIREVVGRAHAQNPASTSSIRTTYQGLGPPDLLGTVTRRVVSTTGGFSVDLGPAALAKRVEIVGPDGARTVQHWIELYDGETKFEAACFDDTSESDLAARLQNTDGLSRRASSKSGTWFTVSTNGRSGRIRLATIAGRGCVASAEGPAATFPAERAEAFLASIRPAEPTPPGR